MIFLAPPLGLNIISDRWGTSETLRPIIQQKTWFGPSVLTKRESQAVIAFNAGNLRLKTAWGSYYKGEERLCLAPFCSDPDTLEHLKVCKFYKAKWSKKCNDDIRLLAKWLVSLDKERRRWVKKEALF